jgi:hypothetical protein
MSCQNIAPVEHNISALPAFVRTMFVLCTIHIFTYRLQHLQTNMFRSDASLGVYLWDLVHMYTCVPSGLLTFTVFLWMYEP